MRLCEDLRQSVLQAAIQGKLTEQRPEDGTAEDLLKEIRAGKERLINEGKIKPEKPLKAITDDEKPFDIPENWAWVRLGDIAIVGSGTTPEQKFLSSVGNVPFYKVADMNKEENMKIMKKSQIFLNEDYSGKLIPFPSIIFPKNGGAIFTNKRRFLKHSALIDLNTGFIFPIKIDIEYLFHWFSTIDLTLYAIGSAVPTVNATIISKMTLPLPPLAEQERIVKRLDELLPLCEAMKGE